MRTYVVRDSSGKLYVVVTDLLGDDAVYRQFALDIIGRRDALDDNYDTSNVDIDVFGVPHPPSPGITVLIAFEGDD